MNLRLIIAVVAFFAGIAQLVFSEETASSQIQSYKIESPFQHSSTTLRILLPDDFDADKSYKVLYVLPVHENDLRTHGDGLLEVMKLNYHNRHQFVCVAPEFTSKPWYADHSTNKGRQDESHLLKTILPYVDNKFPTVKTKEGRLLIGFSKSGWGALTLLLRNPDLFHKAAAWDTGIRVDTGPIEEKERAERIAEFFGSPANFENYRVSTLLKNKGKLLGTKARIFYYNCEGFRGINSPATD